MDPDDKDDEKWLVIANWLIHVQIKKFDFPSNEAVQGMPSWDAETFQHSINQPKAVQSIFRLWLILRMLDSDWTIAVNLQNHIKFTKSETLQKWLGLMEQSDWLIAYKDVNRDK